MFFTNENKTFHSDETNFNLSSSSTLDQNNDLFWLFIVGIFVTFALGWMICRHRCSAKEDSSHLVRCCPKSLGQKLRSICRKKKVTNPSIGLKSTETSICLGEDPKHDLPISESNDDFDLEMRDYPLKNPSNLFVSNVNDQRRSSSTSWPFQSTQLDFYSHSNGLKQNLFFHM